MKIFKSFACLAILTFVTTPFFSQTVSPMSEITKGLFSSETDKVVSTTSWNTVNFNKFFLTGTYGYFGVAASNSVGAVTIPGLTFDNGTLNTHATNIAGMFKAASLTIGISYLGEFPGYFDITNTKTSTETKTKTFPFNNKIKVLFGIPLSNINLGVRVGVDVGGTINKASGSALAFSAHKNESSLTIIPNISFGTVFNVNNFTLIPTLDASFAISDAAGAGQGASGATNVGPLVAANGDYYEKKIVTKTYTPSVSLGLGLGLPQKNDIVKWSASFGYDFSMKIMPEKTTFEKNKTEVLQNIVYKTDERIYNSLKVGVTSAFTFTPKFSLNANAKVQAVYEYAVAGGTVSRVGTNGGNQEVTVKSNSFYIVPIFALASTYKVNDIFSLYAGAEFVPFSYTFANKYTTEEGGANPNTTISHITRSPFLSQIGTGLQFTPVEQFSFQAGVSWQKNGWTNELTSLAAVFSNAHLRLSITWKDIPKN